MTVKRPGRYRLAGTRPGGCRRFHQRLLFVHC
jgi:hypothetical protein